MKQVKGRLLELAPVLLLVSFATFALVRVLPGDPARAFLGPQASQQEVALLRHQIGLDRPIISAYGHWLARAFHGDLGQSYQTGQSVVSALAQRLPVSIELMLLAQVLGLAVAVPVGVLTAYRAEGLVDRAWSGLSFATIALPSFVLGLLLIIVFPVKLNVLQISGFTHLTHSVGGNLESMTLPALTLALPQIAIYSRVLRGDMIATLREDHVTMAEAKGLPTWQILFRYALRPSSFSLITLAGLNVGQLMSGAVVVEFLFGLPGVGMLLVSSIFAHDLVMIQGVILFTVVVYVAINLGVDLLYAVLDPRTRHVAAA
ncbi:MAG TPA: ABC transporter permease [Acidimicrobiales bacterium]|nr:ABC transporter permease [Acidimicrobiales bacterium]